MHNLKYTDRNNFSAFFRLQFSNDFVSIIRAFTAFVANVAYFLETNPKGYNVCIFSVPLTLVCYKRSESFVSRL